ncbi:MAG: exodeoxyribonuclease VII large subunit [Bacteroidota bacterium]
MQEHIPLSLLAEQIQQTIQNQFEQDSYWVSARIMNVKKYESNRRCYLNLEESKNGTKIAEMKAVFWSNYYSEIEKFEKYIQQPFKDGTEIICKVKVRFHKIYGLNLDIIQLDIAHKLGALELERQQTLEKLLLSNQSSIKEIDGQYFTYNNQLALPLVIKNIAFITAANSDGQRDFIQELAKNKHAYNFHIDEYLCTIQGEQAHELILEQLALIVKNKHPYDIVVIVRGGGSLGDFKPFDQFELANKVANYPIPIFTGIGHDRNQSIVDLMAREFKTPTKVAAYIVDYNFEFENRLLRLKERIFDRIDTQITAAKESLAYAKRMIKLASPEAILDRGFAIIKQAGEIITDPKKIKTGTAISTYLKDEIIESVIQKKEKNEKRNYI